MTQALVILLFGIVSVGALAATFKKGNSAEAGLPVLRVVMGLLLYFVLAAPIAYLFYGLLRRRPWAWRGSIGFAIVLLLLVLVSQLVRSQGPLPKLEIAPSQRFGAMLARITIPLLLCVYVLRLYFSTKVRAFLGAPQRAQHGR
ncbi:MAG TPA: hypothetical protein VFV19_15855 [Candidatus Polarisedimenticolaceae bacterium]|nr:hypothetical protein [Candidatus Polarisedimenticolaceae bacterium]